MSEIFPTLRESSHGEPMSSVALARRLEKIERTRSPNKSAARIVLASKLRIGVGSLENIIRNGAKRIDEKVRDRLHALFVRELEAEIARLNHELEMARRSGTHLASEQVSEIETHLAAVRSILDGRARQ